MSFFHNLIAQPAPDAGIVLASVEKLQEKNVIKGTAFGALSLPSTVDVVLSDASTTSWSVTWDSGDYTDGTAGNYVIVGTLTPSGATNPGGIVAFIQVNVYEDAAALIGAIARVYYDHTLLTPANTASISNGDAGLNDLGPNNLDATVVNSPVVREFSTGSGGIGTVKGFGDNLTQCLSLGVNGQTLFNSSFEVAFLYQPGDGQPSGTTHLLGATDGVPKGLNIQINTSGAISIFYGNATQSFTWATTSNVLNNGANAAMLIWIRIDFEADQIILTKSGRNSADTQSYNTVESTYAGSFSAGNISSVNPALFDNTNNIYLWSRNVSGTASSNPTASSGVRFGIFPKLTDRERLAIQTHMLNIYNDMESSFYLPSTIDSNTVYAKVIHRYATPSPLLIMMPGWDQAPSDFTTPGTYNRYRDYGFTVLTVGMRGRDGATGSRDASARELHDIYDALQYIKTVFGAYITDPDPVMVGWSGGGANTLAMTCKFPDLCKYWISNFGMSDYGYDSTWGWWAQESTRRAGLEASIGDTPTNLPNEYKSRDAVLAIGNNLLSFLQLIHDEDDDSVHDDHSLRIASALTTAGKTSQYNAEITTSADSPRALHSLPNSPADIISFETLWDTEAIAAANNPGLGGSGTLTVAGYLKTGNFTIWLGNGTSAQDGKNRMATLAYDFSANEYTLTPLLDSPATDMTYSFTDVSGRTSSGTISTATIFNPS